MISAKPLAVIIPMYNEEGNAENCVREVSKEISKVSDTIKLFVINDGSKDRTLEILQKLTTENLPFKLVNCEKNGGYGAALIAGAKVAEKDGFEFGLFMDSDLTNDPKLIRVFFEKAKDNQFDLIKASRYIKSGGMQGVPIHRQLITILGNKVASILFNMGISDCTNGFRAVRLRLIAGLTFNETGFASILEELYYLKRLKVKAIEVPYILTNRQSGKTSFRYNFQTFYRYFKYAFKAFLIG